MFGTLLAWRLVVEPVGGTGDRARSGRSLLGRARGIVAAAGLLALLTGVAWFGLQVADMAGATSVAETLRVVVPGVSATTFGRVTALRLVLLAIAVVLFRYGASRSARDAALGLAALAAALQAGTLHGVAMQGWTGTALLLSDMVHVLAAAAWLGGLPLLFAAIRDLPASEAAAAARRFSLLGSVAVSALVITAGVQAVILLESWERLTSTTYGLLLLAKAGLFALLLAFAATNRWRLVPALAAAPDGPATGRLAASIACEIALGAAVIAVAAFLIGTPPP